MAIDERTLRLIEGMRIQIGAAVDAEVEQLTLAWARAWTELQREWTSVIGTLIASSSSSSSSGQWPSRAQITRAVRVRSALDRTQVALDALVADHQARILRDLPNLTAAAAQWERIITAAQYPASHGTPQQIADAMSAVPDRALDAIVKRTAEQVSALTRPLSSQATAAMKSSLVRGVALGQNPNVAARTMFNRVSGDFEGGLVRAKVIARTEMLDAHRAASRAQDKASADILIGWQWVCTLDKRTCPACLSRHGSMHDLDEAGPDDHQQGRCARVPLLKPWRDLGIDLDEPASLLPDARAWFGGLPAEDQVSIMGQGRLDLLRSGQVGWDDLATKRETSGWRDSWAPTSMADLRAKVAA